MKKLKPISDKKVQSIADLSDAKVEPATKSSIKELFIIYFVFSLVGHYLEVIWAWVKYISYGSTWFPKVVDFIPLAAPYGLGAVALILIVWPIYKKKKLKLWKVFLLSGLVTAATEFMCALLVVILYGKNYFWDYSDKPLNLFGFTWIGAASIFGIGSVVFIYAIYPKCEDLFRKLTKRQISIAFWILFVSYAINLILFCIREFL